MEAAEGLFEKIQPPRLEDAGLEDCALPPESIKEAFFKAASAVRSRATSILSQSDDEDDATCVSDPWPSIGDSSDTLVGITPETQPPGSCTAKKCGEVPENLGDKVTVGVSDADVESVDKVAGVEDVIEEGESCVDELKGLKIGDKKRKKNDDVDVDGEKKSDRPILTEGYV